MHGTIIPHNINQTRNDLYKTARILGDINAVNRAMAGHPEAIPMRGVRRAVGRSVAKTMWRLLR